MTPAERRDPDPAGDLAIAANAGDEPVDRLALRWGKQTGLPPAGLLADQVRARREAIAKVLLQGADLLAHRRRWRKLLRSHRTLASQPDSDGLPAAAGCPRRHRRRCRIRHPGWPSGDRVPAIRHWPAIRRHNAACLGLDRLDSVTVTVVYRRSTPRRTVCWLIRIAGPAAPGPPTLTLISRQSIRSWRPANESDARASGNWLQVATRMRLGVGFLDADLLAVVSVDGECWNWWSAVVPICPRSPVQARAVLLTTATTVTTELAIDDKQVPAIGPLDAYLLLPDAASVWLQGTASCAATHGLLMLTGTCRATGSAVPPIFQVAPAGCSGPAGSTNVNHAAGSPNSITHANISCRRSTTAPRS